MSIESDVASDVAAFAHRVLTDTLEENGPDQYMFSVSVWAVGSGMEQHWTVYDSFGEHSAAERRPA